MSSTLAERIEELAATPPDKALPGSAENTVVELLDALESGAVRAAQRGGGGASDGQWQAVAWVKRGILLGFRVGRLQEMPPGGDRSGVFSFVDKHVFPTRHFAVGDGVRMVPGGSAVRRGAYLAPGVVCMPPMWVNVGAWVGRGTLIDSHVLIGSCAQVGERVHVSAGAQVGGVLEPVNASPVVIEDDALIGGNCGVYEGTVIRAGAVLAAGVVLTRGTPVFDLVYERVYRGSRDQPLEIPARAVVVPGARAVAAGWGKEQGLSLQTPVVVKYRDEKTDLATALEAWLR